MQHTINRTTNADRPRTVLSAALIAALACASLRAFADEGLDEIVVTAQKKSERLQDVPIAITALSAAELNNRGARQAGDVAATVPNMLLNLPYGPEAQPTFTLRGVTTQDFSENQSSPIAMYVDEVYKSVGAVQTLQVYDLDRVEVLRGPQGTLYGKNATGGAVSFYTANPSMTQTDGYVTAGVGNYPTGPCAPPSARRWSTTSSLCERRCFMKSGTAGSKASSPGSNR